MSTDNDSSNRQTFRTTIRVEPTGESAWKATERDADSDCWGRGKTPHEAIRNYVRLVEGGSE